MDETQVVQEQVSAPQEQQKMLSQDEVNRIVVREKSRAAESARRELEEKHQKELAQRSSERNAETTREVDADEIYQQVQDRFNKEMQEQQLKQQMTQVANSYLQKIEKGRNAYQDFDEITKEFDPSSFPQLTFLLSEVDNAGDVLYDLSKNPTKLAGIDRIAEKNVNHARSIISKLSKSISDNKQAQEDSQSQNVSEPLDRLQSSRVSSSNGKMGVRDYRSQPWLRG